MEPKELLKGDKVALTAFSDCDIPYLTKWYNDMNFLRSYDYTSSFPKSESQIAKIINDIRNSNDKYLFAINFGNEVIGVCGYESILWNNGTAVIYIGIGSNKFRGRGLAKEAMTLAVEFAFYELNLHRLQLSVIAYNKNAIGLYESLGFTREGIVREFVHRDNKRYDLYLYGLLKEEWIQNKNN